MKVNAVRKKPLHKTHSLPNLFKHVRRIVDSRFTSLAKSSLFISVAIVPGKIAFVRMLYGPSAIAQLCISESRPAFVGV